MIDRALEIDHLPTQLHVHLIEMLAPLPETAHARDALAAVSGKHRAEPVPPVPHRPVINVDAALERQVLHIPQRLQSGRGDQSLGAGLASPDGQSCILQDR